MDIVFKVGDKVSFSIITTKRTGYKISSRIGKIEEINGNKATIIYRGKKHTKNLEGLRFESSPSELTEFVQG